MFYLMLLICSIINFTICKKYYVLIFICLLTNMISFVLKTYYHIDYSPFFYQLKYLLYIIFFYKFALEVKETNDN